MKTSLTAFEENRSRAATRFVTDPAAQHHPPVDPRLARDDVVELVLELGDAEFRQKPEPAQIDADDRDPGRAEIPGRRDDTAVAAENDGIVAVAQDFGPAFVRDGNSR